MIPLVRQIFSRRELIGNLVARELKSRYKGSALGVLWSLLTPLLMTVIYVVFFRFLIGRAASTESIIVGIFAWQFTASAIQNGMTSVSGNSNLVKKVAFPRWILPLASVLGGLVDYMISLAVQVLVIGVMLALQGTFYTGWIFLLPLLIAAQFFLNLAIALFLSGLNVVFRDTQHLVSPLVSALFFLSPAMYDVQFLTTTFESHPLLAQVYMLNPLALLFTGYRACLIPDAVGVVWSSWALAGAVWPLVFFFIAARLFQRLQRDFADYV